MTVIAGMAGAEALKSAVHRLRDAGIDGPERDGVVGIVICDSGLKYLSTDLWP